VSDFEPRTGASALWVEAVEWLPTGSDSGLLRVRGRFGSSGGRPAGAPVLVIASGGAEHRHDSLPEPTTGDPAVWRGAFVVGARLLAPAPDRLWVAWADGLRADVPVPAGIDVPPPAEPEPGGEVVDRAVIAERRARRAELAEQTQARIAREALKAVEALELRGHEVEDQLETALREHDVLQERITRLEADAAHRGAAEAAAVERIRSEHVELATRADELQLRLEAAEITAAMREAEHRAALEAAEFDAAARAGDALQAVRAQADSQLNELRVELEVARAELAARSAHLAEELDDERARFAEREAELLAAVEAAEAARREAADGARELARRDAELVAARKLAEREAELTATLQAAEARVARQADDLAALSAARAGAARRADELAAALAAARAAVAARSDALAAREHRIGELERELEVRPDPERLAGALQAISRLRAESVRLRVALRVSEAGRAESAVRLAAGTRPPDATRALEARLRTAEDEVAARRSELVAARADLQATRTASAAGEVARVRAGAAEAELALALARAETAESQLGQALAHAAEVEAELARWSPRTLAADLEALRERSSALEADLAATRRRSAALEAELADARRHASTLQTEVSEALSAFDAAHARLRRQVPPPEAAPEPEPTPPPEAARANGPAPPPLGMEEGPFAMAQPAAPAAPLVPAGLAERAREQAAAAAAAAPTAPDIAADLDAAAGRLKGPHIVSAPGQPARAHVTGRSARAYPPLRGALVKLAHDDPQAAAALILGLLPAQGALLDAPLEYDLTVKELGTFAVTVGSGRARAEAVAGPRPRAEAAFHLRADAVTLAELLAGSHRHVGRVFGRARLAGNRRRLRALEQLASSAPTLAQAVAAGARLDPAPALKALAYAVPPGWTRGHVFTVAYVIDGETTHVTASDGAPLLVAPRPPAAHPADARVTLTRAGWDRLLADPGSAAGEDPAGTLASWFGRLQAFPA
jgi:hypothetical protein